MRPIDWLQLGIFVGRPAHVGTTPFGLSPARELDDGTEKANFNKLGQGSVTHVLTHECYLYPDPTPRPT